jgi:tetratricopeptide (TPR) repeat protein
MSSRVLIAAVLALTVPAVVTAQSARIASDFEIEQMQRQAATAHDFISQLAAHLNLGDQRLLRNETTLALAEYRTAESIARRERSDAHQASDMTRYARATMYSGLAAARLDRPNAAFELLEEAARYASHDAKMWNIYASAMTILDQPRKAASAARNAVTIAERTMQSAPSMANRLDLTIYQYSLALALLKTREDAEAQRLLETVVASLRGKEFDPLRKSAARSESFEVYSTVTTEMSAYLSLLNRSQLRLAHLFEEQGDLARARKVYADVLGTRSDDADALAALARLSPSPAERAQAYADAFDANPFSIALIRDYEQWLKTSRVEPNAGTSAGAVVRRALEQRNRGENLAARGMLESLASQFPDNDVVQYLAAENDLDIGDLDRARRRAIHIDDLSRDIQARTEKNSVAAPAFLSGTGTVSIVAPATDDLRRLIALFEQQRITPEQRVALDKLTFTSTAVFDPQSIPPGAQALSLSSEPSHAQTIFESGSIDGIPFRFSEPIAFAGTFAAQIPLSLTYRILGITELNGAAALLLEPRKLEVRR